MLQKITDKIRLNAKIAFYGAGTCAKLIYDYIKENRKDIKVVFAIDSIKKGFFEDLEIKSLIDLDFCKNSIDCIVLTIAKNCHNICTLLNYLDIPFIELSPEEEKYLRTKKFREKQKLATNVFKKNEDKNLYNFIWNCKSGVLSASELEKYAYKKYSISKNSNIRNHTKQYLEFINKDAIKTIIDGGFHNGINSFSFKCAFKNLKNIYAFEPLYDNFKNEYLNYYIQKDNIVKILPYAMWDKECTIEFCENISSKSSSRVSGTKGISGKTKNEIIHKINATSIDKIKKDINKKIDFIKMDIEGSELKALQGAKQTLISDRPQLAISIYHSDDDFVNIPLYLNSILKNYEFKIGHYSYDTCETILYAIPEELY